MYFAYIIQSLKNKRYYVGSCENLEKRLCEHNSGKTKSTKAGIPWRVIRFESFNTRQESYKRELQIKSYKGGQAFKKLIGITLEGWQSGRMRQS